MDEQAREEAAARLAKRLEEIWRITDGKMTEEEIVDVLLAAKHEPVDEELMALYEKTLVQLGM